MHRIDSNGTAVALPTPGAVGSTVGYFTQGNPGTGTPATVVSADWMNAVQEELIYCILQNNGSLDKTTQAGLQAALLHLTTNRPGMIQNLSLASSVGASAMTVTLKDASGNSLSSTNIGRIAFGSVTATAGSLVIRNIIANATVIIPSTATLGAQDGIPDYIYIWALDNAGTIELGVSGANFRSESRIASSTAISSSATASNVLYSTSARTNVSIRLLGRLLNTQSTAGTWASAGTTLEMAGSGPDVEFESGSFTVNFTAGAGASGSNTSMTMSFTRNGKIVNLFFDDKTNMTSGTTSSNFSTAASVIPKRLRPGNNRNFLLCSVFNGTAQASPGKLTIASDGSITLNRIADASVNFTSGTTSCGMQGCAFSYSV